VSDERIPPSSLEAEMAVIGSVMIESAILDVVRDIVKPQHFYAVVHELIYAAIIELADHNSPIDLISLAEHLQGRNKLETCGGFAYLSSCQETTPTAANAEYYASIVREKAQLRGLIKAGGQIVQIAVDGESDVKSAVAAAESAFSKAVDLQEERATSNTIFTHLKDNYLKILEVRSGEALMEAHEFPWPSVTKHAGTLMPGEFCLWPAPPKVGKTGILLNIADHDSENYGSVVFFSIEMMNRSIAMRYVAMRSDVSVRKQREAVNLKGDEMQRISDASMLFERRPIYLFDRTTVSSIADMRSRLRAISVMTPIKTVIVDGINLLDDVDARKGDRSSSNDRLDTIYKGLVKIGIDYHCVVHAAQHVNRSGMEENVRPMMQHIRGGGNPEGHAHAIISPFRENPLGDLDEQKIGDFTVLAAREGTTARIDGMRFLGHSSLWTDPLHGGKPWWEEPKIIPRTVEAGREREEEYAY
jgi:replicative DNA helicase